MTTLDTALEGRSPRVLKIDVEGYEREVIAGAAKTLASREIIAVIMETNGSGSRYGVSDAELHRAMIEQAFVPCSYVPFTRSLTVHSQAISGGNTIYINDQEHATARVKTAPSYDIAGRARI
jgi:hypothetical protein